MRVQSLREFSEFTEIKTFTATDRIHEAAQGAASQIVRPKERKTFPALGIMKTMPTAIINMFTAAAILCAFEANAQTGVLDDGFSFTPDPVNIIVGGIVNWTDDGTGPYQIISDTGAWATFVTPGGIRFTQSGTYSYHDDAGDFGTVIVANNLPPSVTITNPASNAVFSASASFAFSADAYDPDTDGLLDVKFYVGTNLAADVFTAPFTTTVTNLRPGTNVLSAIAYDNLGASATNQISIYVQIPGIMLRGPRLTAGAYQFDVSGLTSGRTNILQVSTNLASSAGWVSLATNVAHATTMSFTNKPESSRDFFRLLQLR